MRLSAERLRYLALAIGAMLVSACAATAPRVGVPEQNTPAPPEVPTPRAQPSEPGQLPSAPLARGSVAKLKSLEVVVTDFVRGSDAWKALRKASDTNSPAQPGWEYALVRLALTGVAPRSWVGCRDFRVFGADRVAYFHAAEQPPEPELANGDLAAGRSLEGWCVYLIRSSDHDLILMITRRALDSTPERRYVALENKAALPPMSRPAAVAEPIGESRETAAAPGRKVVTPDWSVSVLRIVRGEAAQQLVEDANPENDPPAEGLEFIAIELHAAYHGSTEQPRLLSPQQFQVVGDDGKPYDRPIVLDVRPNLNRTLLPGGEHTGWAVFQVAPGDTRAVLRFQPYYPEQAIRYLALSEGGSHAAPEQ